MTRSVAGRLLLLVTFTSLAASQIAVPQRVRVDESVMRALRIKKFDPTYPPSARSARIQGAVALQIQINKSGGVQDIALLSGHPMLAPAAVEAVKQWQYKSYVLNGELVEVETTVTLNFKLPKESAAEGVVRDAPGSPRPGPIVGVISLSPLLPSSGSVPHPIGISTPLAQTLLVTKVNPEYPPEAKSQHFEGEVVLQIVIDEDGDVYDAVLISGHPMLAPGCRCRQAVEI
jgi:TonB family protein